MFGIPARIHSDQDRSFDNKIISSLCKMYGIRQSTTTPYNPHGNSQCKWFNRTLFSLMKSLDQEQKPNWLTYLPSLVFTYNATPHSTTGYQPYELMFGGNAPTPCDNWLGLGNYKPASFKSKTAWLNEQLNSQCKWFNRTLFSLMKSLDQEQKPNWLTYLPSLVFTYNATPHSTTGYQPYELMFGGNAPTPCDNWLGLGNYKPASFKSKTAWLNEQLNAMLYANKQALKGIHKSTKRNQDHTSGKDITIPVGNHVLLWDHPEGCNKIQDHYKPDVYIVVGHHPEEPNIYYI